MTPALPAREPVLVTIGTSIDVRDPDDGRLLRTLQRTPEGAFDSDVQISADGASTYVLREYGGFAACDRNQVVSVATGGGEVRPLVEEPTRIADFAVAPDRRTVAYERTDCSAGPSELVLLDLATGRKRVLDRPDTGDGLAFAPDSRRLVAAGQIIDTTAADPFAGAVRLARPQAFDPRFRPSDGQLVVSVMEVDEGPISVVAVDDRTGRDVGAVRPITSDAGSLVSDPSGMRYVGLRAYDEMLGQLVAIRNSKALPLGKVKAFAVAWG